MKRILQMFGVAILLCLQAAAADLPAWTDDSSVVLRSDSGRIVAGQQQAKLTAAVFHPIDAVTNAQFSYSVKNEQGSVVRILRGSRTFQPAEPIEFAVTFDGRDDVGRLLPDARYIVEVSVELNSSSPAPAPAVVQAGATGEVFEQPMERVNRIVQTSSTPLQIASTPAGAAPVVTPRSQVSQDPAFPFNHYYGTLHTQTTFSDGGHPNDSNCASSTTHAAGDFTPAQAYDYGRNTAHLDFLGISDHNHLFAQACPTCTAAQVIQRYHDGLAAAAAANVDGAFVAIYGQEWGFISNSSFPNEGHVGLFETPKLLGWDPTGCTLGSDCFYEVFTDPAGVNYPAMYTAALANPSAFGAFGSFNHPSDGTKSAAGEGVDFDAFQYTTNGDDLIHSIAVISGPATDPSTTGTDTGNRYAGEPVNGPNYSPFNSIDMYNRALSAGFHVAPAADSDVHCSNYGTSTRDRTVIASTALTKAALFDAWHHRRMYATSLPTAQMAFTMNANGSSFFMGDGGIRTVGPVATSGAITLHSSAFDAAGHTVTSIKIKEPVPGATNGAFNLVASSTASPFDFTFTPAAGKHAYYAYITLNSGDEMWSAPIWINQGAVTTPDFSIAASPASQTVIQGAGTSYTTTVTALNGFTGTVDLSVVGLPAGATATFTPASVATSGTSTLAVSTLATTPAATYTLTITGTSGALTHSATVTLVVGTPPPPDFSISATPSSQTVVRPASTTYTVTVGALNGFTGVVSLSVTNLPRNSTASFSPTSITGSGTSTLTINTASNTRTGTRTLTITGTSGTLTHSTTVNLAVQ
jgi:hypothetical protein